MIQEEKTVQYKKDAGVDGEIKKEAKRKQQFYNALLFFCYGAAL